MHSVNTETEKMIVEIWDRSLNLAFRTKYYVSLSSTDKDKTVDPFLDLARVSDTGRNSKVRGNEKVHISLKNVLNAKFEVMMNMKDFVEDDENIASIHAVELNIEDDESNHTMILKFDNLSTLYSFCNELYVKSDKRINATSNAVLVDSSLLFEVIKSNEALNITAKLVEEDKIQQLKDLIEEEINVRIKSKSQEENSEVTSVDSDEQLLALLPTMKEMMQENLDLKAENSSLYNRLQAKSNNHYEQHYEQYQKELEILLDQAETDVKSQKEELQSKDALIHSLQTQLQQYAGYEEKIALTTKLEEELQSKKKEIDTIHLMYSKKFIALEMSIAEQCQSNEDLKIQSEKAKEAAEKELQKEQQAHQLTRDNANMLSDLLTDKIEMNNKEIADLTTELRDKKDQIDSLNNLIKSFQDRLRQKEEEQKQSQQHQRTVFEQLQGIIGKELQILKPLPTADEEENNMQEEVNSHQSKSKHKKGKKQK